MTNSVSRPFEFAAVAGHATGAFDTFDYVDALPDLLVHPRPRRVPQGAPIIAGGWCATRDGEPFETVTIVLDGDRQHAAQHGLSRPDVAAKRPELSVRTGYRCIVPTGDIPPGGHELRAYARDPDGRWYEVGHLPFWVAAVPKAELPRHPATVRISVEQSLDLSENGTIAPSSAAVAQHRFVLLVGWALDNGTRRGIAGAVALDTDGRMWSAPCDVLRPDIGAAIGAADERLGFEIVVPAESLGRGRHVLTLHGFDADGRLFAGGDTFTVEIAAPQRAFAAFARRRAASAQVEAAIQVTVPDQPPDSLRTSGEPLHLRLTRGAVVEIDGWAIASDGEGAANVFVELDVGRGIPPQRIAALSGYRRERPEITLPPPPVENGWFSARLDTVSYSPGTYMLRITVLDEGRRTYAVRELGTLRIAKRA